MSTNHNHKNRKLIRLQPWDYRWAGSYFITICTQDREHYFGEVVDGKMQLSQLGIIADILWYELKNRTKNMQLGEFVIMPNHIHGILILNEEEILNVQSLEVRTLRATSPQPISPQSSPVRTLHATSRPKNELMSAISPKADSISAIVRSYKSAVTKHANRLGFVFKWQSRFHDHIIRDEKSFNTISDYIINNPEKWEADKFYK
jgi:putative transposase